MKSKLPTTPDFEALDAEATQSAEQRQLVLTLTDNHGAGPTIALGAPFLGTNEAELVTQKQQQRLGR